MAGQITEKFVIHWFRQDLRLNDNPSLFEASKKGKVFPLYILDDVNSHNQSMGAASRIWLHHSLISLSKSLNGNLSLYKGNALSVLKHLCISHGISEVHWNQCYEPWRRKRDETIKEELGNIDVNTSSYNGSLLWNPDSIRKEDGTPYKVFTPFYRKGCLQSEPPSDPLPAPKEVEYNKDSTGSLNIDDLNLLPSVPWDKKIFSSWAFGERAAHQNLKEFLTTGIKHYKKGRDYPSGPNVSKLSPYLHLGEISPRQIWQSVKQIPSDVNTDHFCSELGWREFSYSQLYFNPQLPQENLQSKFDRFPWKKDEEKLSAWQKGLTGIPMVDAGMRELWQTGYMHNRVRMITGSFLVKNLLLHWHHGKDWFWDCLVDADLANNSAGWQWIAGCGADAAPYFRIFNPVTQGQKFDPEGKYVRRFLPELANLPTKYLFNPWEAPTEILEAADVIIGSNYPEPIVDLKKSRLDSLEAFNSLKL
jgi:deoxyribodipyrimidine photo-lyase